MTPPGDEKKSDGQQETPDKGSTSLPSISLPKGGGAIRGMGEKFAANPVTGTGSLSVPIFTTPSRSDFYPKLSLSYDSGAGNGPFGFGWHLSVPMITRKTDKGLPRYKDADDSDVFILSEAEDLVPALVQSGGNWVSDTFQGTLNGASYTVQRFRPRVEGLFARIERWTHNQTGETFWKSVSKDNITSLYGTSTNSRIANRDDLLRVFTWLLDTSYDDKGNVVVYEYKPEDGGNIPRSLHEQNRQITAKRYLKRIYYGNRKPYYPAEGCPLPTDWCFQVVFDYGEHGANNPRPIEDVTWTCRLDPFSNCRAGFEVRTYRVCKRALMFHYFPLDLDPQPYLVRSTDFAYSSDVQPTNPLNPNYTFLASATQAGYIKKADGSGYDSQALPPLEFEYSQVQIDETLHFVDPDSLENLPYGVDGAHYRWVDLDGEGSPGILTEQADGWYYKRNVSNLPTGTDGVTARFEPTELVTQKPSLANLSGGAQQLVDVRGDGQLDLVQFAPPVAGFYERTEDGGWQPFAFFASVPNIEWNDPNLRTVDLDGDGHADILISQDAVFTWYPSLAQNGFGPAEYVRKPFDEDQGPALVLADGTQSIYLADLSGDGLSDLVRIRNGEVCYWPNLGYGRFGAKITMDDAPVFDTPELFDQKRVRLADVDGSGTTDIIYLGSNQIFIWFNQSGNCWSAPNDIPQFPATDDLDSVSAVDLFGNGTACLVWSSPLPGDAAQPMRYIDLMGGPLPKSPGGQTPPATRGQKPHLLISVKNNLGAETRVQYAASTKFYLQDRAAGNPWITRLPFPVHVVERVETFDYVDKTKFVTLYRYHHGYFDGIEREFRGFCMVEQWDTESFSKYSGAGLFTQTPEVEGEEFHLPPVHTTTWFHTGAFVDWENISQHFADEYYMGDSQAILLPDSTLPNGLTADETREAARALKGRILRQEIFADDNLPQSPNPYSATDHNYRVQLVQPRLSSRYAVFYAYDSEALAYHYERNPHDPRLSHQLTLEVDGFGNVLKSASVTYPRRTPLYDEQKPTLITYAENDVINVPDQSGWYRLGLPVETRIYELTDIARAGVLYATDEMLAGSASAVEIPYEAAPSTSPAQKRMIEHVRTVYLKNDLSTSLPPGQVESLALPYQSYKLAFTPGLLNIYANKITIPALTALLSGEGKYQELDGNGQWWIPSGRAFFSIDPANPDSVFARNHFYLPHGSLDPFGNVTCVTWDVHNQLLVQTLDAVQNVIVAHNEYRVMHPGLITDPNNNRAAVAFDALGLVAGTAVMGKALEPDGKTKGDSLQGFAPDLTQAQSDAFLADPLGNAAALLGQATTRIIYDLHHYQYQSQPIFAATLARETHVSDLQGSQTKVQVSFSYSSGTGREVMKKVQAEPGDAPTRDVNGFLNCNSNPQPADPRWVGTGRTVFDNKGNPIKKYEPFFTPTHEYEDEKGLVECGVTPILRYDPLGRLIRTDLPNGTFSTVEFDAWQQVTSDENDSVRESEWYKTRGSPDPSAPEPTDPETRAAWLAARHAYTPTIAYFDTLARTFLTIADNGAAGQYPTRVALDIEGNQRSITDALGRKVMTYDYDILSTKIHSVSVDAGERWMLNNVVGKLLRVWDSRDHAIRHEYDALLRPTNLYVQTANGTEQLVERTVYGESQGDANNHKSRVYQVFDGAGVVTNNQYDFKGNLLNGARRLLQNYKDHVDWSQSPALESETFTSSTTYDALNRPVTLTAPDASVIRPAYNEANLLEQLSVNLRGSANARGFVTNIDYNAKGQRELIEYGNGARTAYEYDRETFRLIHLLTRRDATVFPGDCPNPPQSGWPGCQVQNLGYTYDPVGNITHIQDDAQQTIYFQNQRVEPSADYTYDAIYRLVKATGREHIGQAAQPQTTYDDSPRMHLPLPTDGQALRNYGETYQYDAVGNILALVHAASNGNWTRTYAYDEPHTPPANNRLTSTTAGAVKEQPYTYDLHGNILTMPPLSLMQWDFRDQLQITQRQVVNNGTGERTYYVYDAAGQRVRKVTERANGTKKHERIYLSGFEIYSEYDGSGTTETLERETLHIMDDKQRIALVETRTKGSDGSPVLQIRYQFGNHLGSAALELGDAANIVSYEEYYPYGSTSYQAVRNQTETPKRYRYTGKERDEESGFYYHGARYYAPWLGRWMSCDPVGIRDTVDLYIYAKDNPLRLSDPTGTQSEPSRNIAFGESVIRGDVRQDATSTLPPDAYMLKSADIFEARHAQEQLNWVFRNIKENDEQIRQAPLNPFSLLQSAPVDQTPLLPTDKGLGKLGMSPAKIADLRKLVKDTGTRQAKDFKAAAVAGLYVGLLLMAAGGFEAEAVEGPVDMAAETGLEATRVRPGAVNEMSAPLRRTVEITRPSGARPGLTVTTEHGVVMQGSSPGLLRDLEAVESGAPVYSRGAFGKQFTGSRQFGSLQNPLLTPDFAAQQGMTSNEVDWVMSLQTTPSQGAVTRLSPAFKGNPGGAPEVVLPPYGGRIRYFHMP